MLDTEHDDSFASLLDAAARQDPDAVRDLVDEFQPALTRFARRQGAIDPDEVVNTALFQAVRNLGTFRGEDRRAFRAYLYQITRRQVTDELRRNSRRPGTVGELDPESSELVDLDASSFDDRLLGGYEVDELLDQLTVDQREVLELRVMTGLSVSETADRTGRSETAVKALQHRALRSLQVIVVATACLLMILLGVLALASGRDVVVVDNTPVDSAPDEQGLVDGIDDGGGSQDEIDLGGDLGAGALSAGDGDPTEAASAGPVAAGSPAIEPASIVECSIIYKGPPTVGELAFVDVEFSRSVSVLEGEGVILVDPAGGDHRVIGGFGASIPDTNAVRLPFTIGEDMVVDDDVALAARTADGAPTGCERSDLSLRPPCRIFHDGSPAVGEEAYVRFVGADTAYEVFDDEVVDAIDAAGRSAMVRESPTFAQSGRHPFTIHETMFVDDQLQVATTFVGVDAVVHCWVAAEIE